MLHQKKRVLARTETKLKEAQKKPPTLTMHIKLMNKLNQIENKQL